MDLSDYQPTADLSLASTIPARWYIEEEFLAAESRKVFAGTWQPVGKTQDVAAPGDFFACEIVGEPVVVARGRDGVLRAFSNVCRHRASTVASGRGNAPSLRCPYHGWTYSLDGKLIGQPEFEGVRNWDRASVCLPQFRAETWGPFVFVNQDPAAPSLAEVWGDIPQEAAKIGCRPGELRFSERRDYVLNCNWKVYIDNYLEGYHLPAAHPGLFRELDYRKYRVDTFRYYSSQYAPIQAKKGPEQERCYSFSNHNQSALYYWIFPNFMLNIYPDNMSSNLILPLGHEKTLTIFEWFSYTGAPVASETIAFSDEIQQEDITICENVQRGLKSSTYTQGRFSVKRENGVHHFHILLAEFLSK